MDLMPTIYDNKEHILSKGINEALASGKRADFCIGYFNLRGWKEIADSVETLTGDLVTEGKGTRTASGTGVNTGEQKRFCRLLVGMQKAPLETLKEHYLYDEDHQIDQGEAAKLKKQVAQEFKNQLTIGAPTSADEASLQKLNRQMKAGKVTVKLHLRYQLHAKLYLVYHNGSSHLKTEGYVGSSNLTFAGLVKQGELNVDVLEQDAALKLSAWFDERWNDRWCFEP